ncbi:undecaprenyl-diphosphate phosphatase [Paracoccus sp. S-4012]|uniref:undecaprenyl-diphosphate phosphatase n=1 Tax=Paracoccus sp. S-4012 TaxID=2665648 RepID=UPI001322CDC0|nr:undecaprenyl-diphosphate phosphatase [Paracoccus sp. S-4012]
MSEQTLIAAILGIVEGLTEFIPVSSTAHVLLAGRLLGFESPGRAFEVLIQLGAVLAILGVYSTRLWQLFGSAPRDPSARRFILAVLLAFLPAVGIGVLAHDFIKTVLFESPRLIATMLILGGVVLLFADRLATNARVHDVREVTLPMALAIGFIQCLAMIPGVSRSGATIVGALALGADKRTAAEFSFYLAMPTMAGAFAYDLMQNRAILDGAAFLNVAVGFVLAFLSAVVVVRWLLGYVSRHGYAVFAWWRIVVGLLVFVLLSGDGSGV